MLKRIASTGVNLVVLGVSVGIFLVAFIALNALGAAQKPPTISVLSATRDLNIGDVITANDLAVKTVFQDDNANLYIPGEEVTGVVGGIVAQPIGSGQPIFRNAIVAPAAEGTRLSAVLAQFPGHSLYPLPSLISLANTKSAFSSINNFKLYGYIVSTTVDVVPSLRVISMLAPSIL